MSVKRFIMIFISHLRVNIDIAGKHGIRYE